MTDTVEALTLLLYLIPGACGYFAYLTILERKFETSTLSIIPIVVLSLLSVGISSLFSDTPVLPIINEDEKNVPIIIGSFFNARFFHGVVIATMVGGIAAVLQNKGIFQKILMHMRLTRKTGEHDTWHKVLSLYPEKWCKLRFVDGSELVGHHEHRTPGGNNAQLFLSKAIWRRRDAAGVWASEKVQGPGVLIKDFDNVVAIDILDGRNKK